jgi:hypothetical protein
LRIANIEDFAIAATPIKRTFFVPGCCYLYLRTITKKQNRMGVWQQLAEYLYLKKRDPNNPNTTWMKYMHGINRISIFMFLLALIVIIIKILFFKRH